MLILTLSLVTVVKEIKLSPYRQNVACSLFNRSKLLVVGKVRSVLGYNVVIMRTKCM